MEVWVPFTDLAPETRDFSDRIGTNLTRLHDETEGYGLFFAQRWAAGHDFVVVEQDVVPTGPQVVDLWDCPEPLCFYGYEGEDRLSLLFGCVKFSAGFIAAHPNLWADYLAARDVPEGHPDHDFSAARCRRWMMLPEWVDHSTGAAAHFHGRVRHLARLAGSR